MPIIVGAPRSGTTLLRFMLDAHPDLAIPPETGFLALAEAPTRARIDYPYGFLSAVTNYPPGSPNWPDFGISATELDAALRQIEPFEIADGFRAFYRLYAARMNKPRWGDKTPAYVRHIATLRHLLAEARFIHIVRDGRDTCLSWREAWFRPSDDFATVVRHWREWVLAGRLQGEGSNSYLEVRYEDLVADPAAVLKSICSFIELEFDPTMLRYHERAGERLQEHRERRLPDGSISISREQRLQNQRLTMKPPDLARVGAWRQTMPAEQQREFVRLAGDALRTFDYEC
jgi:hypothetical protein